MFTPYTKQSIRVNLFDTIHWDFINYNVNVCVYFFEILIVIYSDFTFDKVNFDLLKRQVLNKYYDL